MTSSPSNVHLPPGHPIRTAKRWLARFHRLHLSVGLFGNVSFFVGSVLFLWETTKLAGTWLFILGSLGMLLGSVGDAIVDYDGGAGDGGGGGQGGAGSA